MASLSQWLCWVETPSRMARVTTAAAAIEIFTLRLDVIHGQRYPSRITLPMSSNIIAAVQARVKGFFFLGFFNIGMRVRGWLMGLQVCGDAMFG